MGYMEEWVYGGGGMGAWGYGVWVHGGANYEVLLIRV